MVDDVTVEQQYAVPEIPPSTDLRRHFLYVCHNADLSHQELDHLRFITAVPNSIRKMDAVEDIETLLQIGRATGQAVMAAHFGSFI
jgi:hypothetical protein